MSISERSSLWLCHRPIVVERLGESIVPAAVRRGEITNDALAFRLVRDRADAVREIEWLCEYLETGCAPEG